ncbi:ThiF family adenylyltransferase [Streptomyces panaciradicis]|uniref:ThiF family adenylyltransferase n=1 Tax=Streptomyces panaciradicis TaxID=1470261 RepID=UPI00201CF1B9|nr:ThiF family adenylyltransferase [Streptomyces panaciradicis]MCL6667909.1 ThiF family adenylyltransferase [Streptomyces panaciradicis]
MIHSATPDDDPCAGLEPTRTPQDTYRPLLLNLMEAEGRAALTALLESGAVREVHDRIDDQLEELVRCLRPGESPDARALAAAATELCAGVPRRRYGTWIWYPWSGRLVHLLPAEEFRLVRTDRNRDKITRVQQQALLGRRIGVLGLSVGNSAALTCAMEGVGGSFRLADFDRLGLSNLNRLRAGVHDLGVEKTVLCARQMYEIDPYLDIEIYREGVSPETVEAFFGAGPGAGLDLLIEECDTLWAKFAAREHARDRRIPVLMDANDRGLLDVERFDLEPDRPLFHGRAGESTAQDVRALDAAQSLDLLLRIVDADRLSPAMTDAIGRIGRTLSSWPQLASGIMLGAALVTDTARRILLGAPLPSGRHYADLEALVPADHAPLLGTAP